ncbi:hypothetical protein P389DRAFT_210932 [Cystobasidium minutum MCA 4210]|uniref:uncharacterized protein n=1 Tax=Cystobasidium minutum MCA 4210 TaxID=1397322 RepID=UPI0034CEFF67|eukprot:jgi/Rhomi1/210932/estExt_Genemark1.C_4_t20027
MIMTRGIQLSTLSGATSTTTGNHNQHGGNLLSNNGRRGRKMDDDERRSMKKGGASLVEDVKMMGVESSSPRSARYSARNARKSMNMHNAAVPVASITRRASVEDLSSDTVSASQAAAAPIRRRSALFNPISYSALVTISIVALAWTMVQPVQAALSCQTDADCSAKGSGKCKQGSNGASTCVYKSCSAGYWGAGNTYSDCFECPPGMTSLEHKAFYETDCFLPCGGSRCYVPDGGWAECSFEPASATNICNSSCDEAGYVVINPEKPYATCVLKTKLVGNTIKNGTLLTNQSTSVQENTANKRKLVKLFNKRATEGVTLGQGRRLKLKKDVDLRHQGPAVALLRDAGRDPLALVSK